MKLIILIPARNEEKTIGQVIRSIPRVKEFKDQQVLVVNDGSVDKTAEVAEKEGAIVVHHNENKGLGAGFQTLIAKALELGADMAVMIDADGQFPAKEIPKLIKPILEGRADMVTACRFMRKSDIPKNISPIKLWGNRQVARILSLLLGKKYKDVACGFRAYSKEALLNLNIFGRFTYTQEVFIDLSMKGLSILEIPIKVKYFKSRKSRVFKGAFDYATKSLLIIMRTVRDYKPLKFFGAIGVVLFLFGLIADIFLLIHYINNKQFTPYISVGFLGAFLNILGLIFFIVGFVADMLGKIRANQEKLLYFEKKKLYS